MAVAMTVSRMGNGVTTAMVYFTAATNATATGCPLLEYDVRDYHSCMLPLFLLYLPT